LIQLSRHAEERSDEASMHLQKYIDPSLHSG
jgi:hypothetical protein